MKINFETTLNTFDDKKFQHLYLNCIYFHIKRKSGYIYDVNYDKKKYINQERIYKKWKPYIVQERRTRTWPE
jgi:hypothetical protein